MTPALSTGSLVALGNDMKPLTKLMNFLSAAVAIMAVATWSWAGIARPFNDPRSDRLDAIDANATFANEQRDPACQATTLVSAGGAAPRNPRTLAVRWTGFSNFELAVGGRIILLDAYFDRGSIFPPLGFKAADIKKADLLLIGHGHVDHMSDAASVGARTGATVIGAPVTIEKLMTQPIEPKQLRTVTGRGGEILKFDGFTVEPILGRHGSPTRQVTETMEHALSSVTPPMTAEQRAEQDTIRARGTSDPRVVGEGTIAYLITLDNGFRILFRDSGGRVTDIEKAAMERIGRVDLALVAVSAEYLNSSTVSQALEHMRTYKPDIYMPAHHDAPFTGRAGLWRSTEPLFQAMKDENPALITVSKQYREPVCFNTEVNIQRTR
jgi:L-ascorbate metabolism protein UlaG (beta-lactamase superfamily)